MADKRTDKCIAAHGQPVFDRAMAKFKSQPYNWPQVSCISMIRALSDGLPEMPDYSKWLDKTETRCLSDIRKLAGITALNYVKAHAQCLGSGWVENKRDSIVLPGDIVFAEWAEGRFVDHESGNIIDWQSFDGFPATMFGGYTGDLWCFAPIHGLKIVHRFGDIIRIYRRADI